MFFNGLREAGRRERENSLCTAFWGPSALVVVPPATYHSPHIAISRVFDEQMSECVETCVDFNAKIGGNSRPECVVYKQVKSKRHINEVPSYEMTQCADIIRAFLSLYRSLEECVDLSAQSKMIKTKREDGRDFSVFICFQNMCLAIYLFSAIKIQYPRAIIITTIRGGLCYTPLQNVAQGPRLRLRFAFVLPQLDLVRCCWCCCPSVESSNEFSARLHLKRRALKLRSDSRPRSWPLLHLPVPLPWYRAPPGVSQSLIVRVI